MAGDNAVQLQQKARREARRAERRERTHNEAIQENRRKHSRQLAALELCTEASEWRDEVLEGLGLRAGTWDFDLACLMIERPPGTLCDWGSHGFAVVADHNFRLRQTHVTLEDGRTISVTPHALAQFQVVGRSMPASERDRRLSEIANASRDLENGVSSATKLSWRLLPNPPTDPSHFRSYLDRNFGSGYVGGLDLERLAFINSLGPSRSAAGRDEFDGYIAFLFDNIALAVLDCPKMGNAIYLLEDHWAALSRLPKRELLNAGVKRVIHRGEWRERLRHEIRRRGRSQGKW